VKGFLQVFDGISKYEPAKLKLHIVADDKSIMQEILFTTVRRVNYSRVGFITIEMVCLESDPFSFYADTSVSDTIVWFYYCDLLCTIPCHAIPEMPQENSLLQQLTEWYTDPRMFNAGMYIIAIIIASTSALEMWPDLQISQKMC